MIYYSVKLRNIPRDTPQKGSGWRCVSLVDKTFLVETPSFQGLARWITERMDGFGKVEKIELLSEEVVKLREAKIEDDPYHGKARTAWNYKPDSSVKIEDVKP